MSRAVMQQALEALVAAYQGKDKTGQVTDAITALKQALAEPEFGAGMTLRDWFAGMAMQGMLAAAENYTTDELAVYAYDVADAMLKQREASNE